MPANKNNIITYGKSDEDWRNHVIDKMLCIKHTQWLQQHREAFLDYQDYLKDQYSKLGCVLIGYSFVSEGDDLVIKMMDNHHNLLKTPAEQTVPPCFAFMRIRRATEKEAITVSKSIPNPEQSMYMAEEYYRQWISNDALISSLASVLLFFISVYTKVYQYRTVQIDLGSIKSKDTSFRILMSNGQQTVELNLDYVVLDREYKALLKRAQAA